jgi:hypothetical protein
MSRFGITLKLRSGVLFVLSEREGTNSPQTHPLSGVGERVEAGQTDTERIGPSRLYQARPKMGGLLLEG